MGKERSLTEGPIGRELIAFAIPLFLGQLLQQLYNMADAWVVGNFADNDAFAAVSMAGNLIFAVIGLFNGIAIGGGVVISRYFGAGDEEKVSDSVHTNLLLGLIAAVLSTVAGVILVPHILQWLKTPDSVMPHALLYFQIYFGGVATVILYNTCMAIMRALGDSLRPLYYLILSSAVNVVLDLIFVAGFHWGAAGAAIATVIAQGLSVVLCLLRMRKDKGASALHLSKLKFDGPMMRQVIRQGVPTGIQNSVISIGNLVVQSFINSFGAFAMSGHGAFAKIEGLAFLPIMAVSMALPTFISQNLGARKYDRAKKGTVIGLLLGVVLAELVGVVLFFWTPTALRMFVSSPEAISYGTIHGRTVSLFFFLLAFTHCSAGALRGCGKAVVPMFTMLVCWCGIRILYVSGAIRLFPVFRTISSAYPLTWGLSALVLVTFLWRMDWEKASV